MWNSNWPCDYQAAYGHDDFDVPNGSFDSREWKCLWTLVFEARQVEQHFEVGSCHAFGWLYARDWAAETQWERLVRIFFVLVCQRDH